jgi:hypothetical protein
MGMVHPLCAKCGWQDWRLSRPHFRSSSRDFSTSKSQPIDLVESIEKNGRFSCEDSFNRLHHFQAILLIPNSAKTNN